MKWIIEEEVDGVWFVMVEEGLSNPYTNPELAWADFRYIVEGADCPEDYRLVAKEEMRYED